MAAVLHLGWTKPTLQAVLATAKGLCVCVFVFWLTHLFNLQKVSASHHHCRWFPFWEAYWLNLAMPLRYPCFTSRFVPVNGITFTEKIFGEIKVAKPVMSQHWVALEWNQLHLSLEDSEALE